MLQRWLMAAASCVTLALASAAFAAPTGEEVVKQKLGAHHAGMGGGMGSSDGLVTKNFKVLGHNDLGLSETNGDVFVYGNFAYVGTWSDPCNGRGVKILDVSDLSDPQLIATAGAREGTSAEDMVVRRVSTPYFHGDLMGIGIQRCGEDPALDSQEFGLQLWNVTNPHAPVFITEFGVGHGSGGVHELDLFQRGDRVYALLAHPFSEWFDPSGHGDFMIVDVTNPSAPVMTADWGAGANGFSRGPFWGQGDFGSMFGHSARASSDGMKAYASYWDLGVLTFDISDVTNPVLLTRTTYEPWEDGDAHSMTPYTNKRGRDLILQNDEDFAVMTPADIDYGARRHGLGNEGPANPLIWNEPGHKISAPVVMAANQGCEPGDYPAGTAGKIAVAYSPFPFFDPAGDEPLCLQGDQELAAEAAGALAIVHGFVAENTSPQWFDPAEVGIHVVFTDQETAEGMVAAGWAKIKARKPSWGYLRIYDAETGEQVAKFDDVSNVHRAPAPPGAWSIHNTEILGSKAYNSWYANGITALWLGSLNRPNPRDPELVGQFIPGGVESTWDGPSVWGVATRSDGVIFASDMGSGLWIVKPKGQAAP